MKTLIVANIDTEVSLAEIDNGYQVTYGLHSLKFQSFVQALDEFNSCVKHSAACASLLDDNDEYQD